MSRRLKPKTTPSDQLFITTPSMWPRWPLLPLVHRSACEPGFLVDSRHHDEPFTIYLGSIYDLGEIALKDFPIKTYANPSDLLTEWRID